MKQTLIRLVFGLLLFSICFSWTHANDYNLISASYLGSAANDTLCGVAVQSDGTLILAGAFSFQEYGGVETIYLEDASTSSVATLLRLSTDGQTVLSVSKLKEGMRISDLSIDGNDNIYLTLGDIKGARTGTLYILSPTADSVLFANHEDSWTSLDASLQGFFAVIGGWSIETRAAQSIRLYDPQGLLIFEKQLPSLGLQSVSIDEESQQVIVTGFTTQWMGVAEYHLPFYIAYDFHGAEVYRAYDLSLRDQYALLGFQQARPYVSEIGQDGYLYFVATLGQQMSYSSFWSFDPFNGSNMPHVGGDQYHSPMLSQELYNPKKRVAKMRVNPHTGEVDRWQMTSARRLSQETSISFEENGALSVCDEGKMHLAGSWTPLLPQTYDPVGREEGAGIIVMSQDMTTREFVSVLAKGAFHAIHVRKLNGEKIMLAGGYAHSESDTNHIANALQTVRFGGTDGYFVIFNTPGTTDVPNAPSNLRFDSIESQYKVLKWVDNANNEDGFVVERRTNEGDYERLTRVHPNQTQFTDLQIESGKTYEYRIAAYNLQGNSSYTESISFTANAPVSPDNPTSLSITCFSEKEVCLSWHKVNEVKGYLVEMKKWNETSFQTLARVHNPDTTVHISKLKAGTTYHFRVRSFTDMQVSGYSPELVHKTNDLPLHKPASANNVSQGLCYTLYQQTNDIYFWPDFSDTSAVMFVKEGYATNPDPAMQSLPEFTSDTCLYAIKYVAYIEVPRDGTYELGLLATNKSRLFIDNYLVVDNSSFKGNAWKEKGQIGLKQGMHELILYIIQSTSEGVEPLLELTISGPEMEEQYVLEEMLFRKSECQHEGQKPSVPTNLTTTEIAGNIVILEWETNADNVSYYSIEITPIGQATSARFFELLRLPGNSSSCFLLNIMKGENYEVRIRAVNAHGFSEYSNIIQFTTSGSITLAPAPPDQLKLNYASSDLVNLVWRDNAKNETGFVIEYKQQSGVFSEVTIVPSNFNSGSVEGLEPDTEYVFRVKAINEEGDSYYSNEVMTKTLPKLSTNLLEDKNMSVKLYPNPTDGDVWVAIAAGFNESASFFIYSITGQPIKSIQYPTGADQIRIYLSELPSGIYLVEIKTKQGISLAREKLIKE